MEMRGKGQGGGVDEGARVRVRHTRRSELAEPAMDAIIL